jgi:hypothetical protein
LTIKTPSSVKCSTNVDQQNTADAVLASARAAAIAQGHQPDSYDVVVYYAPQLLGCYVGYTATSLPGASQKMIWVNGGKFTADYYGLLLHELGHTLGLGHGIATSCTLPTCTVIKQDDPWNVMGRAPGQGGYSAPQRYDLGWLAAKTQDAPTAITRSASYTLQPIEDVGIAGTKAIRMVNGTGTFWLEYRTRKGADQNVDSRATEGVLIHQQLRDPEALPATDFGSYLVDTTPGTPLGNFDAALTLGRSWTNPVGNALITVTKMTATEAQVTIGPRPPTPAPPPPITTSSPTSYPLGADYDRDGRTDLAVWRPSNGQWFVINSSTGAPDGRFWGLSSDIPVQGDYDADGRTDSAVWRPLTGEWLVFNSSTGLPVTRQWGARGDIPVPGDYDGDKRTDFAVWRPTTREWFVIRSATGAVDVRQWGLSGDVPVPGDYDGDARTDWAVWRPTTGQWFVVRSSNGAEESRQFGSHGDIPVPGNYDGDKSTDFAVWRPSSGDWHVLRSSTGALNTRQWGTSGDVPVPGDYDGDKRTDFAVWRPAGGHWFVIRSSDGAPVVQQWGAPDDIPVAKR